MSSSVRPTGTTGSTSVARRTKIVPTTNDRRDPRACASLRRGTRPARGALAAGGARGALRPLRPSRLWPGAAYPARRSARRRRRTGGIPLGLAHGVSLRSRAREGEHMDSHARPPACSRPRAPRGAPARRHARARAGSDGRRGRRAGLASPSTRARPERAPTAARPAARSDRARVLRRLHAVRAGGEARSAPRYDQESDVHGSRAAARAARRAWTGDVMDAHDLTAAYALDALDADDREAYETHLGQCERCRAELATLGEAATALAWAVASPAPPQRLRDRILGAAAAERQNVVSLPARRQWLFRGTAAAAAVAACGAIGLGIWAGSLSHSLSTERSAHAAAARAGEILADPGSRKIELNRGDRM